MASGPAMERDSGAAESICSPDNQPILVRAIHAFRGVNNDELVFAKDDVIVVTQRVEGGWWEGTFDGKTGWFPSNYVKPFVHAADGVGDHRDPNVNHDVLGGGCGIRNQAASAASASSSSSSPNIGVNGVVSDPVGASRHQYHNVILKGIVETQTTHVNELRDLWQAYLLPLGAADVVPDEIYASLTGNLAEVIAFNAELLRRLEETASAPLHKRRVGGCFMAKAVEAKAVFERYFSNHPVAIEALDNYREELREWVECRGGESAAPGDRFLTQGLKMYTDQL